MNDLGNALGALADSGINLTTVMQRCHERALALWDMMRDDAYLRRLLGPPEHFNPSPMFGLRTSWAARSVSPGERDE